MRKSGATPACSTSPLERAASDEEIISLEAEVPEVLLNGMRDFLASHPQMDQMELIRSALASFLFQNGCEDQLVSQHYLDGLFRRT